MIKSFKITNKNGESLFLDIRKPEETGFLVSSVSGLASPKAEIATSKFVSYDGSVVGGARASERNIVFSLIFYEDNLAHRTVEDLRHDCYYYFPLKEKISIEVTNDSGTYYIDGYVEANETNIFTKMEGASISIICPDPYFWFIDEHHENLFEVKPNFEFPVKFEDTVEFSIIDTSHIFEFDYDGVGECGITINIQVIGSVGDIHLYNELSNTQMTLVASIIQKKTGSTLVKGDYISINTRKGEKSATLIRNGVKYNILNAVNVDSQWLTLRNGLNRFSYAASSGGNYIKVSFEYKANFWGV